jgi:hypothetical protein
MGGIQHAWEREMHPKCWPEIIKRRNHSEDLGIDRKIILEWIFGK